MPRTASPIAETAEAWRTGFRYWSLRMLVYGPDWVHSQVRNATGIRSTDSGNRNCSLPIQLNEGNVPMAEQAAVGKARAKRYGTNCQLGEDWRLKRRMNTSHIVRAMPAASSIARVQCGEILGEILGDCTGVSPLNMGLC